MTILKPMKTLLTMATASTALAGLFALVVLAVLILVVIPGGVGILTIEAERASAWMRRACAWLWRTGPTFKQESTPC